LLHAAAGGVGLIVSQWAKLLGLTVIGTVSTEAKAKSPAPMAATMSSTTAMKTWPSAFAS
jgi:NADPH:quinone reductase-like Zn-dependent oxidoreductase